MLVLLIDLLHYVLLERRWSLFALVALTSAAVALAFTTKASLPWLIYGGL